MNKSLIKKNYVIVFNILYVILSVWVIGDKILAQMFSNTPSTLASFFYTTTGMDRFFHILDNYYGLIAWLCILYFGFLLSNIVIYHKNDADYKLVLPLNLATMFVNTLIALYYGINHYMLLQSTDGSNVFQRQTRIIDSFVNNDLCMFMIMFIAVGVNLIFLFLIKHKKPTNVKTAMLGITISSLPMLIIPIVTLIPVLQMWNLVG